MKKIYFLLFAVISIGVSVAHSQVVFTEDFNYPSAAAGDSIGGGLGTTTAFGDTIWKKHSGTATGGRAVKYTTTSLSFPGYAGSGIGGAASFQETVGSADINGNLSTSINSGNVYTAFMLRVDSSAGKDTSTDYFFHYCDVAGVTGLSNFRQRIFASDGSNNTTFKLGMSKGSAAKLTAAQITAGAKMVYTTTEYNLGQTYLVIAKYTFNSISSKDDALSLFVFPNSSIPLTEPAADISFVDTAFSDLAGIKSICIRQGSIGRTLATIDGFRVFRSWNDVATILPVKLSSFTTQKKNSSVIIDWVTEQEINSKFFIVQRSADGINWLDISTLSATGNGSLGSHYSSTDNTPLNGFNYYRLKQVNVDGSYSLSKVQKVLFSSDFKALITPNPVKDFINIYVSKNTNESVAIKITDINGKIVHNTTTFDTQIQVPTVGLSKGIYFVKVSISGNVSTQKIVIQ